MLGAYTLRACQASVYYWQKVSTIDILSSPVVNNTIIDALDAMIYVEPTTTTTHIVQVQQHPRDVVTEHEPSRDLVRERRSAGQKPATDNKKKDKKFCPGQDVGTRAYYAKTIIEGRLRSKSSTTNKKTYYITVEVKRIYKNESNFRALNITEKIRLHFAIGRYKGCDRKLADGLVKAQLVNGKDYIFFLQSLGPHNYTVLGPPEPLDAKKVKAIKDIIYNKKVKEARINVRLTNKTVKVNDILRLTCGVRGNPPPIVTWYKDGREIRGKRKRPRIKHMEKKSVLSIQNVDSSDAGKYECRAKGVIGKVVSSSALVTIQQDTTTTTTTTVPTDTEGVPCGSPQNEELCLNGGTCFFYTILGEMGCRCGEDYTGHRCENKAVSGKSSETQSDEESK
ncbi:vein [Carabus blaptoides fortunei]